MPSTASSLRFSCMAIPRKAARCVPTHGGRRTRTLSAVAPIPQDQDEVATHSIRLSRETRCREIARLGREVPWHALCCLLAAQVDPISPIPAPVGATNAAPQKASMGKRRKWAIGIAVFVPVIAVVGALGYHWWSRPPKAFFRTVRVVRADITERVTRDRDTAAGHHVAGRCSGVRHRLPSSTPISIRQVKAGDLLVELDPALFQNAVAWRRRSSRRRRQI
jgi:hypothetical protein